MQKACQLFAVPVDAEVASDTGKLLRLARVTTTELLLYQACCQYMTDPETGVASVSTHVGNMSGMKDKSQQLKASDLSPVIWKFCQAVAKRKSLD